MKNKSFTSSILCIICVFLLVSCGQAPKETQTSFDTMVLKKEDRTLSTNFAAKIQGKQDVSIIPRVSGTITEVRVVEGQKITKGQVLFIIDPRPFELAVQAAEANTESAKAQVATAKLNYESNKGLYEKKIVSSYVLETAENNYNTAKAALALAKSQEAQARNDLSYCSITSPVTGVVGALPYRVGDLVNPSIIEPLTVVSDNSSIIAFFSINESFYTTLLSTYGHNFNKKLQNETPDLELKLKDGTMYEEKGRMISVSGVVDPVTGAVSCKAEFPNPKGTLSSGISETIVYPTEYKDVIVIPQTATVKLQDKYMAYKVEADNTAKCTIIEVESINDGQEFIVLDGLKEGDEIITAGVNNVQDGMQVKF